jgi:ribosomal protein S18 acetylase RimI-like enzyme
MESTARQEFQVRSATPDDAADIADLLEALGYESTREDVDGRLRRLLSRSESGVFVAEIADKPVAVASYQLIDLLERGQPQCRVTTLVTDREHRRRGAATALIQAIESIARERRCFRLEVTTRPERADALDFYAELGFCERPHRLVKYLEDPPSTQMA